MQTYDMNDPAGSTYAQASLPNDAESIMMIYNGYETLSQMGVSQNDGITLNTVADMFARFLRSAGFDYVDAVTITTSGGNEFSSDIV